MSNKARKVGKVILNENDSETTISFDVDFAYTPSVKVTSRNSSNIYISDVTVSSFKVNKNVSNEKVEVHYIAIEGDIDD